MGKPLVLTFDVGTQSARCLLVNQYGEFKDICQLKYDEPYFSKYPGWAEQKPDFYYKKMCEAGKIICERNKEKLTDIIAVTITVIRDSVLLLDKNNKPMRDIILWLDKRQAEFNNPFPLFNKIAFKLAGMETTTKTIYQASICNWLRQNEGETLAKANKFVMLPTYLNYKLTGNLVDSEANMIGHIPFDYKNRKWDGKHHLTRCITYVEDEKLCDLVKSGEVIGKINHQFSLDSGVPEGLPLIATGSDKGCESLGLSVINENQAAISLGTTATLQFSLKKYVEPLQFMPAYPAVLNDRYNPEIEIYRGLWLISWFIKEFAGTEAQEAEKLGISTEQLLDSRIVDIKPCSNGLLLQPYWTPGLVSPNSKGAIIGFGDYHTKYHVYRAIIEGLAFELYTSLTIMERRSKEHIDEIFVGGGGARSNIVCQILADVIGTPIKRTQTHEASSIGASMVAFVAKGIFKDYDEAIKNMVQEKDVFTPNKENHKIYMEYYKSAYSKMFPKLEPIYRKIIKITNKIKLS